MTSPLLTPRLDAIPRAAMPPNLRERARERWEAGDIMGAFDLIGDAFRLDIVVENFDTLRERGVYEPALLRAYPVRFNFHHRPEGLLRDLFKSADREPLRAASDPLPGPGPFVLYRGLAGHGRARRIRGLSWTTSVELAWWYARRFEWLPDPAVFRTTVEAADVLAYLNESGRDEEFLVLLPPSHRVERVRRDTTSETNGGTR